MTPIIVAGGGPAGATAATLLARAGRKVVLLERTTGPTEKICGEFLSGEARQILARAGFDTGSLGGHDIGAVRLIRGARCIESRLPFTALGISRGRLDEALLRHAADSGVETHRGRAIQRAETQDGSTTLTLSDGTVREARTLFLATGKHDLRGLRRDAAAEDLVGFKMHFTLPDSALRELSGHVEIMVFRDAYAGLQRIEDGRVNLCLLARRRFFEAEGGGAWDSLLDRLMTDSPHLRARLAGAVSLFERPLSIFRVPYGFVHAPVAGETVFRLGDQAAVIPSFTGDGMAIALHSAALAATRFLGGDGADSYHRQLARDVGPQVRRAWALYRLGAAPAGQAAIMRAVSFFPSLLRVAAAWTRVPTRAIISAKNPTYMPPSDPNPPDRLSAPPSYQKTLSSAHRS